MSDESRRITLNKGYTKDGFADKVYHVHLRYTGDNDELYFRDYLNEHPRIEEIIPGIVMCVMGLCLLFISAERIWIVAEKWKTIGGERPSKSYVVITRALGIVFMIVGVGLLVCSLI